MELRRDLERRGFAAPAAVSAVSRLEAEGWLQDLEAARALARVRGARYGRARVARELSARGFSSDTAALALEELAGGREQDSLRRAFGRFWKSSARLPDPERRRRVRRALRQRGFAAEAISAMMHGRDEIDGSSGEIP